MVSPLLSKAVYDFESLGATARRLKPGLFEIQLPDFLGRAKGLSHFPQIEALFADRFHLSDEGGIGPRIHARYGSPGHWFLHASVAAALALNWPHQAGPKAVHLAMFFLAAELTPLLLYALRLAHWESKLSSLPPSANGSDVASCSPYESSL